MRFYILGDAVLSYPGHGLASAAAGPCLRRKSARCVESETRTRARPNDRVWGGLQNGPQDELLNGQCSPNLSRDVLQCDIHNGLMKWNITEITFQVIRGGDPENEHHYYRERASIASLQTETITIKLGMQLPADTYFKERSGQVDTFTHWSWLIVGAKGTVK